MAQTSRQMRQLDPSFADGILETAPGPPLIQGPFMISKDDEENDTTVFECEAYFPAGESGIGLWEHVNSAHLVLSLYSCCRIISALLKTAGATFPDERAIILREMKPETCIPIRVTVKLTPVDEKTNQVLCEKIRINAQSSVYIAVVEATFGEIAKVILKGYAWR